MVSFAAVTGDTQEVLFLGGEKSRFSFFCRLYGGVGIFDYRGQCRIGEGEPSGSPSLKLMGEQPESICITLEVCKVLPMIFVFQFLFYYLSVSLGKISCDSSFTRMPERRISQIVGKTCRRGDGSQVVEFVTPRFVFVFFAEHGRHVVSQ